MGVTLREGSSEYFYKNLDKSFPRIKNKYHNEFGNEYLVYSDQGKELMKLFHIERKRRGIVSDFGKVFEYVIAFSLTFTTYLSLLSSITCFFVNNCLLIVISSYLCCIRKKPISWSFFFRVSIL